MTNISTKAGDSGSVVVETILLVPAMMLVFLVIIQFALWAYAAQTVQLAASVGDRVARSAGGGTEAGVIQAKSMVGEANSGLVDAQVGAETYAGDVVGISVSGKAVSIVPGLSLPVSAAQAGPVQEFRESG